MAKTFNSIKTEVDELDIVTFGKFKNNTWRNVLDIAPEYVLWCVGNMESAPNFTKTLLIKAIKNKALKKSAKVEYKKNPYGYSTREYDNYASGMEGNDGFGFADDDIPW